MKNGNKFLLIFSTALLLSCGKQGASSEQTSTLVSSSNDTVISSSSSESASSLESSSEESSSLESSTEESSLESSSEIVSSEESSSEISSEESSSLEEDDTFSIHVLEMQDTYGDSFIINIGSYDILVDGGTESDATYVRAGLKKYVTDGVLDMLIVTHPHNDHTGGLSDRNTYREITSIGTIIDYGYQYSTSWNTNYEKNRNKYIDAGAAYYPVYNLFHEEDNSPIFPISDDCYLEVLDTGAYLAPSEVQNSSYNHNDTSVACSLHYKGSQFFFAGDLEKKGEQSIIAKYPNYFKDTFNIFKASHHGSETSNSIALLDYLNPQCILISAAMTAGNCGVNGIQYEQHPYRSTLRNFAKYTDQVYWNGTNGTINAVCDGSKMVEVKGDGATHHYYTNGVAVNSESEKDLPFPQTAWYHDYL